MHVYKIRIDTSINVNYDNAHNCDLVHKLGDNTFLIE